MDGKNKKSMSQIAKLPSLRLLALKSEFLLEFEFLKHYKDLYGKCCWWADLAHQQCFPYKSFKFLKNSSCHKNSLYNVRRLKLGHFHIFGMLFTFLASVLYHDRFLMIDKVTWPCHAKSLSIQDTSVGISGIFGKNAPGSHLVSRWLERLRPRPHEDDCKRKR